MQVTQRVQKYLMLSVLVLMVPAVRGLAQTDSAAAKSQPATIQQRDGQHDFDFEIGTWKIHLKRLLHPLTGSTAWVEFDGTSVTRKVWDGRANIEEFETNGPAGHIEGLTLRLYHPESHQWYLYWANSKDGNLGVPTIGEFKNGRGEFVDQESYNGRAILVRYVWSDITPNSAHFEQSFSDDGGKTWEVNWITNQTRVPDVESPSGAGAQGMAAVQDGQHDFDFEFGSWKAHLKRLLHPLSGSDTWIEYDGTSVVRKIWNRRANLGELEVGNATAHIEGLSLRLYNPQSHQWSIFWSNSRDGAVGPAMIGGFKNGRGEFFNQDTFQNSAIFVRFIFSDITPASFRFEQSFSSNGGKTWEPNWIAVFTREKA